MANQKKLSDEHFSSLIRYLQRETNILSEDETCGHHRDESDSEMSLTVKKVKTMAPSQ